MDAAGLIGIASLIASLVAAGYAGLAWHRPRVPQPNPVPAFDGELPKDRNELRNFLTRNEGRLIALNLSVPLAKQDGDPDEDGQANAIVSRYNKDDCEFSEALHFSPDTEEGEVVRAYVYHIEAVDPARGILGRGPAGGWVLRGGFIPRGFKSYRCGVSYGSLIQIDDVRQALLRK